MDGYEFMHMDQQNKGGGGVPLFVDKKLKFRVLENMSVNNTLECIPIEIHNGKNIITSCVYRTQGSNIELFRDWMEEMFPTITHKTVYICDFDIDLLRHQITDEFFNTIYSVNVYPKITRPSRITSHCATVIDNIFTNDIFNDTISRRLISDISDPLPVFTVRDNNYKHSDKKSEYRRVRTEDSVNAFKNDLMAQN